MFQDEKQPMEIPKSRAFAARLVFIVCGSWLIGLGLYFIFLRPSLLPEDLRYIGASLREIQSALPELDRWLHHVFTVMGGFMMGSGALTILVSSKTFGMRQKWTLIIVALAGVFTVGTMSLINFQLNSDFKWLLLVPTVFWFIGLVLYKRYEQDR